LNRWRFDSLTKLQMKTVFKYIIPILILFLFASPVPAWKGRVVAIKDGDTIEVLHNNRPERIRLYGIDCPELHQDFGSKAKEFTSEWVFGKIVGVEPVDRDRYGRTVAWVWVHGKSLNKELVRAGLAWHYKQYAPENAELEQKEVEARSEKIGIWSMKNPTPPWEYRRQNRIRK
jgi:micrococcal nuclease